MLGLGLALAIVAAGGDALQSALFGVSPRDSFTYGVVVVIVAAVALVATLVPARQATRVDPMIALRAE
jgi:ABC-type antimicrobial peptide transport system permease subunit